MPRACLAYITFIFFAVSICEARDLAIIVNKANPTTNVAAPDLEKLLSVSAPNWPDGKKVRIFMTDPASSENKAILQKAYKIPPAEIKALVDAHKAEIQIVGSDDIVLTMVSDNPGAIGIVNVYSITSQVKVLKVDGKLPMEQGYLLHGN